MLNWPTAKYLLKIWRINSKAAWEDTRQWVCHCSTSCSKPKAHKYKWALIRSCQNQGEETQDPCTISSATGHVTLIDDNGGWLPRTHPNSNQKNAHYDISLERLYPQKAGTSHSFCLDCRERIYGWWWEHLPQEPVWLPPLERYQVIAFQDC